MGNSCDRAKQFMPFAALRGYYELVQQKERVVEPRRDLSDEEAEVLSWRLNHVKKGMLVKVRYYREDAYENAQGVVTRINPEYRQLTIVKTRIPFDDILSIDAEELEALEQAWEREDFSTPQPKPSCRTPYFCAEADFLQHGG